MNIEKLNSPHVSILCLMRGLRLVFEPGMRRFVWIPVLINLVLYGAALMAGVHYFSDFMAWLLPAWLDFLRWLLWPLFGLSFLLVLYFTFTILANLIGSPFYGRLAEKVILRARGSREKAPGTESVLGGVATEFRRLGYFATRAVPLLILFLIPGVNLIAPFLWLAFNAWYMGMEYLAYPLEAEGIPFAEQRRLARRFRFGLLGFGGVTMLGLAIPGLNLFVPPAAVAGAALYMLEGKLEEGSEGSART